MKPTANMAGAVRAGLAASPVIGLIWLLHPLVGAWSLIPQALFMNVLVVVLLAGAIMPLLTRLFRLWFYPVAPHSGGINEGAHP